MLTNQYDEQNVNLMANESQFLVTSSNQHIGTSIVIDYLQN